MIKDLSYKTKFRLLWVATVLLAVVIYQLGLSRTLALREECHQMQEQLASVSGLPGQITALEAQLNRLNRLLGDTALTAGQGIITQCSNYCDSTKVRITQIKEPVIRQADDLLITTHELHFEGDYHDLLRLVYYLEVTGLPGKIASLAFVKAKDPRTRKESLSLTLFVQSAAKSLNPIPS